MRSVFDALDGIDTTTDQFQNLLPDLHRLDELMPQMLAHPAGADFHHGVLLDMMLRMYQTQKGIQDQTN